jgi:hypothetical protein
MLWNLQYINNNKTYNRIHQYYLYILSDNNIMYVLLNILLTNV